MSRAQLVLLFAVSACVPNISAQAEERSPVEELLSTRTSLEIEQGSLENVVTALVRKAVGKNGQSQLKIIGKDLQLDGITKNQTIRGFKQEDKTVAEILTALLLAANPNRGVKDSHDAELKLIWTIGSDPDDPDREIVLITTREGARKRGDKVPKVFVVPIRRGEA